MNLLLVSRNFRNFRNFLLVIGDSTIYISGMYTHHQKTVILDAPSIGTQSEKPRLKAFVGGLDLTGHAISSGRGYIQKSGFGESYKL